MPASFILDKLVYRSLGVAFLLFLFVDLLFLVFLWRRKRLRRGPLLSVLAWGAGTALLANLWLGHLYEEQKKEALPVGPHAELSWYGQPNLKNLVVHGQLEDYTVTTDAYGHRNNLPYPADGKLPFMVQGDSNCFGVGLPLAETFCAQLNAGAGAGRFYNFGVPGFDVNSFYFQYELFRERFQVQRRLILFNIGNDFTMAALKTAYYIRRPYLYVAAGRVREVGRYPNPLEYPAYGNYFVPPYSGCDPLIARRSRDWANSWPQWLIRYPLGRFIAETVHPRWTRLVGSVRKRLVGRTLPLDLHYPRWLVLKRGKWPRPFRRYSRDFKLILRQLRDQNPELTICLFPMKRQILAHDYAMASEWVRRHGAAEDDLDRFAFNRYMKETCAELGIRLVDPAPAFLADSAPETLYLTDEHLSGKGLGICATWVLKALGMEKTPDPGRQESVKE